MTFSPNKANCCRSLPMVNRNSQRSRFGTAGRCGFQSDLSRNATAYGISPRLRFGLVLNDFVAMAHLTGKISILSDGTPWRPVVHVEDICRISGSARSAAPRGAQPGDQHWLDAGELSGARIGRNRAGHGAWLQSRGVGETQRDRRCYRVNSRNSTGCCPTFVCVGTFARGPSSFTTRFAAMDCRRRSTTARHSIACDAETASRFWDAR